MLHPDAVGPRPFSGRREAGGLTGPVASVDPQAVDVTPLRHRAARALGNQLSAESVHRTDDDRRRKVRRAHYWVGDSTRCEERSAGAEDYSSGMHPDPIVPG